MGRGRLFCSRRNYVFPILIVAGTALKFDFHKNNDAQSLEREVEDFYKNNDAKSPERELDYQKLKDEHEVQNSLIQTVVYQDKMANLMETDLRNFQNYIPSTENLKQVLSLVAGNVQKNDEINTCSWKLQNQNDNNTM